MIEEAPIVSDDFIHEGRDYYISMKVTVDDDAGTLTLEGEMRTAKRDTVVASYKVVAQITNPLEIIAAHILKFGRDFGLCVALTSVAGAGELCHRCYRESCSEHASLSVKERTRAVYEKLKGKKAEVVQQAKSIVKGCAVESCLGHFIP